MSTLTIQELPPCAGNDRAGNERMEAICHYMESLLVAQGLPDGKYVFLPSLRDLSRFFNSAMVTTHEALRQLSRKGFACRLDGIDAPITCWHQQERLLAC